MIRGILVFLLVSLNLGGLFSLIMQVGRGEWFGALNSLVLMLLLNGVGYWLLREMRQEG